MTTDAQLWGELVDRAHDAAAHPIPAPTRLKCAVKGVVRRVIPATSRADQAMFVALQAAARAFSEADRERRARLAQVLCTTADECARLLTFSEKQTGGNDGQAKPPSWTKRADIGC